MKPTELRIGNKIYEESRDNPYEVVDVYYLTEISINDCYITALNHPFEYIPLTEQWLLDFGFKCVWSGQGDGATYEFENITLHSHDFVKNYSLVEFNGYSINKKLKHVHQLQNIYFALTGEELTLNK